VYYLLGEEFDRDPFLLFKLRGLSREELMALLGEGGTKAAKGKRIAAKPEKAEPLPAEPLAADPVRFWAGGGLPDNRFGEVQVPPAHAALPKRLGSFPFWRGTERFLEALEPIYRQASQRGLEVFGGEGPTGSASRQTKETS
jgi:uncharacterized Zn finger protein